MDKNIAKTEYDKAVNALKKFCEDHTDLDALILDDEYPIRVQFIPSTQLSLFNEGNIDENGEVNALVVTVGLTSAVRSTLKFKMDSKLLKKLIKLAEQVGHLYYQAYREQQGARTTPVRPDYEGEQAYCPKCGSDLNKALYDYGSLYCQYCAQALDWTKEEGDEE